MCFEKGLITLVQANEILFNVRHKGYHRTRQKEKIWEEIANELNSTVDHCRKRWKGLRDTYKRQRKDEILLPEITTYKKKWKYYDLLTFLDEFSEPKSSTENTKEETIINNETRCEDEFRLSEKYEFSMDELIVPLSTAPEKLVISRLKSIPTKGSEEEEIQNTTNVETAISKTSTDMFFSALAMKINEAGLPVTVKNDLEAQVYKIVYDTIAKYNRNTF